jgi:TonB family protein
MQISSKKHQKIAGFCAAFLLHFALLAVFYFSIFGKVKQPEVTLEVVLLTPGKTNGKTNGKIHQEKSIAEIHALEKNLQKKSQHYHIHSDEASGEIEQILKPTFHPLPQIPDDLRDEAFSSKALARFYISTNGNVLNVELIKPCADPRLNVLLLKTLQKWKFPATNSNTTQEISVTFSVQ